MTTTTSARRARRALACLTTLAASAAGLGAAGPAAAEDPPPEGIEKVDGQVLDALEDHARTTFWVRLDDRADLGAAEDITDWAARGQAVVDALHRTAVASQAPVIAKLDDLGVRYQPYWITNAIRVTGGEQAVQALAAEPEVDAITAPDVLALPDPEPVGRAGTQAIVWGVAAIHAPEVWASGFTGEGMTVANIDTGVQFDHPALHRQYRGARTDGTYDHNYNWFDPTQICPAGTPCDNNGHGTHTMGTMVGDDGTPGENRIGVAPAARWLAAKGCESNNCSDSALLAAAQWMLAPTDLAGQNPRPDLRPQVVNNSWGGTGGDLWFQDIVRSWTASGIFGQFSVGNSGPGCGTAGSPGDYPDAYSTGAFGIDGAIASFSSRGASRLGGGSKPDIAAPGVAVRSSIPGNGYVAFNGTSMAAPHVAGTVALMWSANPLLRGNVAATRYLLDRSAIDVDDTSCGGTPADNNVWGEGKLDALGAVTLAITRGSFGPPHITVTRPAAEGLYKLNEVVPADYSCSDTSDPAPTCSGDVPSGTPLDTSTPGFHFFTITSRNRFGVFSMTQVRYQVLGCNGKAPTIVGGPGDDALTGTAGPDVIVDLGGTDSVRSRGGDDTICLGGGDDTVDAGDGADWIDAGAGANVVDAGNGNNTVTTGSGDDAVVTGSGADTITTGDGDDYIESGSGADRVQAMGGADDIATGDGDDAVDAGDGRDTLNLGGGNDAAATALGPDVVDGGAGSGDSCPPGTTPARAVRCEA